MVKAMQPHLYKKIFKSNMKFVDLTSLKWYSQVTAKS